MRTMVPATEEDIADIIHVLRENDLTCTDLDSHIKFIVIKDKNKIIAVAGVENYKPYALLRSVAVINQYKKKGVGRYLTIHILDYLGINGIMDVFLLTTTADKFFEKIGFQTIDRKSVPPAIAQTKEFSEICPDNAVCMRYSIY